MISLVCIQNINDTWSQARVLRNFETSEVCKCNLETQTGLIVDIPIKDLRPFIVWHAKLVSGVCLTSEVDSDGTDRRRRGGDVRTTFVLAALSKTLYKPTYRLITAVRQPKHFPDGTRFPVSFRGREVNEDIVTNVYKHVVWRFLSSGFRQSEWRTRAHRRCDTDVSCRRENGRLANAWLLPSLSLAFRECDRGLFTNKRRKTRCCANANEASVKVSFTNA